MEDQEEAIQGVRGGRKTESEIIELADRAYENAPQADAILISCGGLRTLGVAKPLEAKYGLPVVSTTQAALWDAVRLGGHSGHVSGYGRLMEQANA